MTPMLVLSLRKGGGQYASNLNDTQDRDAHVESGGSSSGDLNAELRCGCGERSSGEGEDGGEGREHGD